MSDDFSALEEEILPKQAPGTVPPDARTSTGEKLFDLGVYSGIAGAGVFLATLPLTYWTKYGNGKALYTGMKKTLQNTGMSESSSEQVFNTVVLGMSGNLAVLPIKAIENKKPEIVEALNKAVGDDSGSISVENEPKQSWGSLIKSRAAAYAMVWMAFQGAVSVFGGKRFEAFENGFAKKVVCEPLGKPTHINGEETKLFRYGKIAALDSFATAAAAALLYSTSRFFARGNKDKFTPLPEAPVASAGVPESAPVETPERRLAHLPDTQVTATAYHEHAAHTLEAQNSLR